MRTPPLELAPHGTNGRYVNGQCRCDDCRAAGTAQRNAWRQRAHANGRDKIPSLGTARRIRALCAIGWSMKDLAAQLGMRGKDNVQMMTARVRTTQATARRVAEMYERLSATPGPSARARIEAARRGWPPPLAWDDIDDPDEQPKGVEGRPDWRRRGAHIGIPEDGVFDEEAVDIVCRGVRRVDLTFRERVEAVRRMAARGMYDTEIAERLGMSHDALTNFRLRRGIAAGNPCTRKLA